MGQPPGDHEPETVTSGDADVHAFLIADVRGYTMLTQAILGRSEPTLVNIWSGSRRNLDGTQRYSCDTVNHL